VKLVPTFADRGCHVVSVTDPYGRILIFLDWGQSVWSELIQSNLYRIRGAAFERNLIRHWCELTSSQQSGIKYKSPNFSPYLFFLNIYRLFLHFYVYIIWISTKPCITPAEGINTYAQYTYIFIYDSFIIVNLRVCCSLENRMLYTPVFKSSYITIDGRSASLS
jgi:hypothetical protein